MPGSTSGQYVGTAFSNNHIPANRINPIAKTILAYYCLPKNSGTNAATGPTGNISDATLAEQTMPYHTLTGKVDHKISANNRMFARYSWYHRNSIYNDYTDYPESSGTWFQFKSWQAVVDDVHVFNPTTVLNVRYGYNRFDRNSARRWRRRNFDLTKLGFPSQYNTLIPEINRYFPRLDFTGGDMVSVAFGNDFRPITSHTVTAMLNKSMGAHALKSGVEIRHVHRAQPVHRQQPERPVRLHQHLHEAEQRQRHGLSGPAGLRRVPPGHALHHVDHASPATYDEYSSTWGFFVQDDWRVNNRLTLNLGLRYEVETALAERDNKSVSGFDSAYVQPIQATAQANYAALNDPALKALVPQLNVKGGLMFAGVDGGSGLYTTPKNTFLPRVGLAYQLNPKTVIRAGVGLFAGFLGERRGDVIQLRLLPDDHRRHHDSTPTGRRSRPTGTTRSSPPRSSSRSATQQAGRPSSGKRFPSSIRIRRCRSSSASRSASSASCRAA